MREECTEATRRERADAEGKVVEEPEEVFEIEEVDREYPAFP
jgi:formylmethanofuran dehydrogenase subunit E